MNTHYDTNIERDWVEFTNSAGNNDMCRWLATADDLNCSAEGRDIDECYDVICSAFAINARCKGISEISPAYYPLNMSVFAQTCHCQMLHANCIGRIGRSG